MVMMTRTVSSFPTVSLPSHADGLPVEVALIAQLGIGAGDRLVADVTHRQRAHGEYVDALDEPSARIGAMNLAQGDPSSLYTFTVGEGGHPFHRHAGHRVFTAVSGSAGALLRFSTASSAQIQRDPRAFLHALRHVSVPPDCLFTVRFGGGTWHQFLPLHGDGGHPALFALSCHTNELGGELAPAQQAAVAANRADIPSLTEVLPAELHVLLQGLDPKHVPTTALSLRAAPESWALRGCAQVRQLVARAITSWKRSAAAGYVASRMPERTVIATPTAPRGSLLEAQLHDSFHHEDCFALTIDAAHARGLSTTALLAAILEGFLDNPPAGVSRLMTLRNLLVTPLRLRTSPLGCPVSSLLSADAPELFCGRYPVLAQAIDDDGCRSQVILGADDRHLQFRSCVAVQRLDDGSAMVMLATRVRCHNLFGHAYLALIERVHRGYIAPTMLRMAVSHAVERHTGVAMQPLVMI